MRNYSKFINIYENKSKLYRKIKCKLFKLDKKYLTPDDVISIAEFIRYLDINNIKHDKDIRIDSSFNDEGYRKMTIYNFNNPFIEILYNTETDNINIILLKINRIVFVEDGKSKFEETFKIYPYDYHQFALKLYLESRLGLKYALIELKEKFSLLFSVVINEKG